MALTNLGTVDVPAGGDVAYLSPSMLPVSGAARGRWYPAWNPPMVGKPIIGVSIDHSGTASNGSEYGYAPDYVWFAPHLAWTGARVYMGPNPAAAPIVPSDTADVLADIAAGGAGGGGDAPSTSSWFATRPEAPKQESGGMGWVGMAALGLGGLALFGFVRSRKRRR